MTDAERQAAHRQRQADRVAELEKLVADQRREIITLRKALDADKTRAAVKAVIGDDDDIAASLKTVGQQLRWSLKFASTAERSTRKIMSDMNSFAISGKPMKLEERKAVFGDIIALKHSDEIDRRVLEADPENPPAWRRDLQLPW
jgi:hypothetical protein